MLKELFENQRTYLNHFFENIDLVGAQKILEKLQSCEGAVIFSGVGKSGHIAEKISATFSSTGTRSFFLNPLNALHGDIGMLGPDDLFFAFSKSGNSQEMIDMLPYVQKKGTFSIAVVSKDHSKLAEMADLSIVLPLEKEICPYDLAPTTSTAIQLIFGDCLAIALMQMKRFSVDDFAANHPGGALGRKITLKVADLMLKGEKIPKCLPQDLLIDVLHELSKKRCGCLLVADEQDVLQGIFTDGDLRRAIEVNGPKALQMPLENLMTKSPRSIGSNLLALDAAKKMEGDPTRPVTVLPVLEEGKLVGLIRIHDILQKELS